MAGPRGQEESRPGDVGSRPRELPNDAGGDLYKLGEVSCEDQKGDDDDEDEDGEKKEDKDCRHLGSDPDARKTRRRMRRARNPRVRRRRLPGTCRSIV